MAAKLGCVNACAEATLFHNGEIVGYCLDTPNAIAYAMSKTHANLSCSALGTHTRACIGADRIANAGWMTNDRSAGLRLVEQEETMK